jgi:hypothetical protein
LASCEPASLRLASASFGLGWLFDENLGWLPERGDAGPGLERHPGDVVEQPQRALTECCRVRILGHDSLAEQVRQGRDGLSVFGGCVGNRVRNETGELLEYRLVPGGRAVVEACACRVDLEVAVKQERET